MLRDILPRMVRPDFRKNDLVIKVYDYFKNTDVKAQQELENELAKELPSDDDDMLSPRLIDFICYWCSATMMLAEEGPLTPSVLSKLSSENETSDMVVEGNLYILMGYARGGHSDQLLERLEKSSEKPVIWSLALSYVSCGDFIKFKKLNSMHDLENTMTDGLTLNVYEAIDLGYRVALESGVRVNVDSLIELMSYVDRVGFREHLSQLASKYLRDFNPELALQQAAKYHSLMKGNNQEYDKIHSNYSHAGLFHHPNDMKEQPHTERMGFRER